MFKNMKLGAKIASGFGIIAILGLIVGITGYLIIINIVHHVEIANTANIIKQDCLEIRGLEKNYITSKKETYFKAWEDKINRLKTVAAKGQEIIVDKDIQGWLGEGFNALESYVDYGHKLHKVNLENNDLAAQIRKTTSSIETYLAGQESSAPAIAAFRHAQVQEKNMILNAGRAMEETGKSYTETWDEAMSELENRSADDPALKDLCAGYSNLFYKLNKNIKQLNDIDGKIGSSADAVLRNADLIENKAKKAMQHAANMGKTFIVALIGICLLVAVTLAFMIIRSITRPINRVIEGLNEASEQVVSASGQVSSSSQSLAEGASEQAASIEETSSSLEEVSSMTKQNAEHSNEANSLMKETNQVVNLANNAMNELTMSMQGITTASEKTQKVVKTIDEIAFQTNLLALNAAVEAARAGEAGAGFAVVAEEVRNLAMRSAEAAKNTAVLIEDTVKKVKDGSELVTKTNESFSNMAGSSQKVGELVSEIAAASDEQAKGIEQVNIAVAEMDKVVQQNAANAEESAGASEEMNAQAKDMKGFVETLSSLVGRNKKRVAGRTDSLLKLSKPATKQSVAIPDNKGSNNIKMINAKMKSPEQIIPMDDFEDF